jgi:hypothetical protein
MSSHRPPILVREAIVALAAQGHVADVDFDGRHFKVSWRQNGRRRLLIISKTPSDFRAAANSRATLRRLLGSA